MRKIYVINGPNLNMLGIREPDKYGHESYQSLIDSLNLNSKEKGYTLVPLQVYFKDGKVKVEVGLARGKKLYDKRADIAKKDMRREAEKEFKVRNL